MKKWTDAARGMLVGLAVGDALGTTLEFGPRRPTHNLHTEMIGQGQFELAPGQWTDDTSMALALGSSLLESGAFDSLHILKQWCDWYKHGKYSCVGECFDIGNATRSALDGFLADSTSVPYVSMNALGNAPLMRLAPVIIFARTKDEAYDLAFRQSCLTHATEAGIATAEFGTMLFQAMRGELQKSDINSKIANRSRDEVKSSGYYKDTLEASLWAVANTSSFEDAVIAAVNLGDDADTVGAVTGQLAGAMYGKSSIPFRWSERLSWREKIEDLAERLIRV